MATETETLPGCPKKCGEVEISYPFGIGDRCFLPGFEITCQETLPFIANSTIQLLQIFQDEVRVNSTSFIATDCSSSDGNEVYTSIPLPLNSPYTISVKSNKFMGIGCNTLATITDIVATANQCVSQCFTSRMVVDSVCNGSGCCQTSIPWGKKELSLIVSNSMLDRNSSSFSPCSYAFVVEESSFNFTPEDLLEFNETADIAMMLEWSIGKDNCLKAKQSNSYVCGNNSTCVESYRDSGYLCACSSGYEGNPYLNGSAGCHDIDECSASDSPCVQKAGCRNKVPGFECVCPAGSSGDGVKDGTGCTKKFPVIHVILGVGLSVMFLFVGGSWLYWVLQKRKLCMLKEKFFHENGGLLLRKKISSHEGSAKATRIFTAEELERATDNYDETRILGKGGYGIVYKGILEDSRTVAIKKSKMVDKSQIDQFINEVVILTQINHKNVVKLLGCCLETQVPMLVYEFIPNGTLSQHIHENGAPNRISWDNRLRIATEIAEALTYLHSSTSMPIFHRDVKSSNILLDKDYTAKVADFGTSRLVPTDRNQITTLVQGTLGYLDPEYFQTSQLTEKSDVYSFGVILVELLTGDKPVSFERSQEGTNLAMHFISSMKSNQLIQILEVHIVREGRMEQFNAVANLAVKCLRLKGEKRPTMKEVAQELYLVRGSLEQKDQDETRCFLGKATYETNDWAGVDYFQSEIISIELGR